MKNKIVINNHNLTQIDEKILLMADSFVHPQNKLRSSGNGEARLYIESQNATPFFEFIDVKDSKYPVCKDKCFFVKDNLIKYLEDSKIEYSLPTQEYKKDISQFYEYRLNSINHLNQYTDLDIHLQNGVKDKGRVYIGSSNKALWTLFRQIVLPKITLLHIEKYIDENQEICFIFLLEYKPNDTSPVNKDLFNTKRKKIKEIITSIETDTNLTKTEKESIIKARKGQGKFKQSTHHIMSKCPFTDISDTFLLVASHIKPWSDCSSNSDRLSGYNGLSLTPTYDKLFDSGLISFENDGTLLISKHLSSFIIKTLNLDTSKKYDLGNSTGKKNLYLDYHRHYIFKK